MSVQITLQNLVLPDLQSTSDPRLYLTPEDGVRVEGAHLGMTPGAVADFGTWINLLNLANWQAHCQLQGLILRLQGEGRVALQLRDFGTDQCLHKAEIDLQTDPQIDLTALMPALIQGSGLLALRLVALEPARLNQAAFQTGGAEAREVRLATCITTFRREAEVQRTARRLRAFLAAQQGLSAPLAAHVFVIDNGQSAEITEGPDITYIPNLNLGGAGGFARALAAAERGDFTHCLFMDDDAAFDMENLVRTHALMALARDPRTALAGAMISQARPTALWEYGAIFHRFCRPRHNGADLLNSASIVQTEASAHGPKPSGFYGGWWYFAFPLEAVRHYPFPFFVRGDDISFSLAHDFAFATLNGVVSVQEDFGAKESPQTLYLDLRNHLHHHLSLPQLDIGRWRSLTIGLGFVMRSLVRMHYASAEAQCRSWEDLMQGPAFFEANADMSAKRPEIAQIGTPEVWQTAPAETRPPPPRQPARAYGRLMWLTLNGHLIPGWRALAPSVRVPVSHRALLWPIWGRSEARFVDAPPGSADPDAPARAYTVHHSKRRFLRIAALAARLSLRWLWRYKALQADYHAAYGRIATGAWWESRFAEGPAPLRPCADPPAGAVGAATSEPAKDHAQT